MLNYKKITSKMMYIIIYILIESNSLVQDLFQYVNKSMNYAIA